MSFASFTIDESLAVSGDTSGCIFFCIFIYALITSSFVNFFDGSKFNFLYSSETDMVEVLTALFPLKENLR